MSYLTQWARFNLTFSALLLLAACGASTGHRVTEMGAETLELAARAGSQEMWVNWLQIGGEYTEYQCPALRTNDYRNGLIQRRNPGLRVAATRVHKNQIVDLRLAGKVLRMRLETCADAPSAAVPRSYRNYFSSWRSPEYSTEELDKIHCGATLISDGAGFGLKKGESLYISIRTQSYGEHDPDDFFSGQAFFATVADARSDGIECGAKAEVKRTSIAKFSGEPIVEVRRGYAVGTRVSYERCDDSYMCGSPTVHETGRTPIIASTGQTLLRYRVGNSCDAFRRTGLPCTLKAKR